ncbi:hypothetical protein ESCAB7627_0745 [Escherichia albertii TW07627]|uniref:Uncharacterized protein n=1 Tax=Escherichia albertii (strain TW07627) TaxID=502347 RepID=A0ABC9NUD1_ESCAT|nr:hypothetical protein ESCAB7627_0745 [Escherichia albertii TW07627]
MIYHRTDLNTKIKLAIVVLNKNVATITLQDIIYCSEYTITLLSKIIKKNHQP